MDLRSCSPEERARIAEIARSHGHEAARQRFGVSSRLLSRILRETDGDQKSDGGDK